MIDSKLKAVLRFVFQNQITITQTTAGEWKLSAARPVDGLDTTRVYPSYDDAIEFVYTLADRYSQAAA